MHSPNVLDGVHVVTMAQYVPGPLAVARLRDAGARVTKIEPQAGDPMLGLSPTWHEEMHIGVDIERVDLKSSDGRARVMALLRDADVFVASQRPSTLQRLGLDPESLHAVFPRLHVVRIVGSVKDPERAGHDLTYQAQSGLLGDTMPRTLAADVMAAERVFSAVLLLLRQSSGATVDIGLVESLDSLVAPLRHGLTTPEGILGGAAPRYHVYAAKVGHVAIAALEEHFVQRLYQLLGVPADADLSARFLERSAEDWERWAVEYDLPIVAIKR